MGDEWVDLVSIGCTSFFRRVLHLAWIFSLQIDIWLKWFFEFSLVGSWFDSTIRLFLGNILVAFSCFEMTVLHFLLTGKFFNGQVLRECKMQIRIFPEIYIIIRRWILPIKKRKVNEIVNLHHSHWCRFTSTFPENMIFTFQFEDDALDNLKSQLSSRIRDSRMSMKFPSCLASTIMRMPIVLHGFQTPRIRNLHW